MRKLPFAINPHLINKNDAGQGGLFVHGWENVELSMTELAEAVKAGHGYTAQLSGPRKAANFLASGVVSVDIDRGMTVEQALANPLIRDHAGLVYTTASHRPEAPRLRVVFATSRTITDPREMKAVQRSLALRLNGDPGAVDAARIFYGNTNAALLLLDERKQLPSKRLDELVAQSINHDGLPRGRTGATRSAHRIKRDEEIRIAGGGSAPLWRIPEGTSVHCPLHSDENASAFVVASKNAVRGVHCSTCCDTYWPADAQHEVDFGLGFEATAKAARQHFDRYRDWGPLGCAFNGPDAKPGLLGCDIVVNADKFVRLKLRPGLTLVRAPKGSGKTEALIEAIKEFNCGFLIGHRRTLIWQTCGRMKFRCYLDPLKARPQHRGPDGLGICLDSISSVPRHVAIDVVILDESEQVLSHLLSDTINRDGGPGADRVFAELRAIVNRAKYVVALDADLGYLTLTTLTRMMAQVLADPMQADLFNPDQPVASLVLNERKPGLGKRIELFKSSPALTADLIEAARAGKRVYVAANSKKLVEKLAAILRNKARNLRTLVVTADTGSMPEQQAFLSNPSGEALNYDAVLASPAVGTGVDIAFRDNAQVIDVVYGFCGPGVGTHLDFDQQIGRVRHPGDVRIWVTPRRFHFETHVEVVKRELLECGLYKNLLIDRGGLGGTARYIDDDPLVELAAHVTAVQRAAQNALCDNFIAHKRWQGFSVDVVEADDDQKSAGRELLAIGGRLSAEEYVRSVTDAPPLCRPDFDRVSAAIEAGQPVLAAELWSVQRTKIERFYRRPISVELVSLDDRGRYRQRLTLLGSLSRLDGTPDTDRGVSSRDKFIRSPRQRLAMIRRLLALTPVFRSGAWRPDEIFDGRQLGQFAEFVQDHKAAVETQLSIEVRSDLALKPVSQLRSVLKLVGLGIERAGTVRDGRDKVYRYRLDRNALEHATAVLADHDRIGAWRFMAELHGWSADQDEDDTDFDDAA